MFLRTGIFYAEVSNIENFLFYVNSTEDGIII